MVSCMNNNDEIVNFNKIINWYFNSEDKFIIENEYLNDLIAKNISFTYAKLNFKNNNKSKKVIKINKYEFKQLSPKNRKYLHPLYLIKKNLTKNDKLFFYDFLIHGSIATDDYSMGWSDLDTYLIINNKTLLNYHLIKKLKNTVIKIKKYLFNIDPLQHHGFIFCAEKYLKSYPSFMLPAKIIQKSKSLIKNNKIVLWENNNLEFPLNHLRSINNLFKEAKNDGILKHHKRNRKYLLDNYKDINTMYQMKYFLSVVMTLPSYYLHAIGKPTYKKDSYDKIKILFKKNWSIIENATEIRSQWPIYETHPYKNNKIPNWIKEILGNNYFNRAFNLSNQMVKNINRTFK